MAHANTVSTSPPKAPPAKYTAQHGTRWEKEKAAAVAGAFDYPDDAAFVGPWIMGETVGKGASGRVKIARHRLTGQLAAVKILPLQPLLNSRASLATMQAKQEKARLGVDREITMMKLLHHPNVMRIYDVFEGARELYLVLEYVPGGELFDFLVNRGRLPALEALAYFKQIVYGLGYAHAFSIIHRDLKPENILIASLNPPLLKIADWGMAAFAPPSLQLETSCGSPHYASPEIVNGARYEGGATDIWSCGVILYALLTGRLPFDDKDVRALLMKVKAGRYDMPSHIDPMARDLLQRMLVVDVNKRITIPQILAHPWMQLDTPGILYIPAPPVLDLARPVRSVDRDLLAGLMVIWGRTANQEDIKKDLLSEAGAGNLAKAFYFLLGLYRDRTMRESGIIDDSGEGGDEDGKRVTKQYTTPAASNFLGVDVHMHGNTVRIRTKPQPQVPVIRPQARHAPATAPIPMPLVRPERVRPQSTPMPNYSEYHRARLQYISGRVSNSNDDDTDKYTRPVSRRSSAVHSSTAASTVTGPASSQATRPGPGSDQNGAGSGQARSSITVAPRPLAIRSRTHQPQTQSAWEPVPMQCDSPPQRFRYSAAPTAVVSTSPHSVYAQAQARTVYAQDQGRGRPQSQFPAQPRAQAYDQDRSDEAMSICDASMRDESMREEPLPLLRAPRVANQEFQRTIDELTDKVNGLAAVNGNGGVPVNGKVDKENQNHIKRASRMNRNPNPEDKENDEFVYVRGSGPSITNTPRTQQSHAQFQAHSQGQGQQPVHAYSPANFVLIPEEEQRGRDVARVPVPLTGGLFAKRQTQEGKEVKEPGKKERRSRALTIDLPGNHLRRFALNSPNPGSPGQLASPSPSPGVGEFKGWFSNLFNWKAQTYVLCSTDDVLSTRNETTRLLEILGVVVALEDGGQLKCRVGDGMALDGGDGSSAQLLKHTRFRVELHASLAATTPSHSASQSSSRSPLPTPTFGPGTKHVTGGSQCVIVLTQEKGTVSTFRTICRRLREEWTLDALQSPPSASPGVQRIHMQSGESGKMIA